MKQLNTHFSARYLMDTQRKYNKPTYFEDVLLQLKYDKQSRSNFKSMKLYVLYQKSILCPT